MIEYRIILTGFLCFVIAFAGCANPRTTSMNQPAATISTPPEGKTISSVNVVKAVANPTEIRAGGTAEAIVFLTIQDGYHINANPPTFSYLKATELEIPQNEGVSVKSVYYPPPQNKKFAFADKSLAVYEGTTQLKATLQADHSARKGERSVSAKLRIQACDDQVCYPPGTLELAIPVSIK